MNSENIGGRPKRATVPSARLRDTENAATLELPSHWSTKSGTQGGNSVFDESSFLTDDDSPPPSIPSIILGQKRKRANADNADNDVGPDCDEAALSSGLGKGMTRV